MNMRSTIAALALALLPAVVLAQASPPVVYTPPIGAQISGGGGAAGRCALFGGATSLTSDSGCTYSGTGATFTLTLGSPLGVASGGSGAATLTGLLKGNGTGAFTALTTSAGISGVLSDETGSGAAVFGTSPTLSSPLLNAYRLNARAITFADTPYTVAATDAVITCDASGGAVVINLPAATGTGRELDVKKIDSSSNACTITRAGSDTIDGATTIAGVTQWANHWLVDSASGKWVRGHSIAGGAVLSAVPTATALAANQGTTATVLHGNAAGTPAFAVVTPADAAGNTSGSGSFALTTSPTFVTPTLGVASATSLALGAALTVPNGGTGVASLTAYAPIFGGTTTTGAVQAGTAGTAGQILTSNGASALPTFKASDSGLAIGTGTVTTGSPWRVFTACSYADSTGLATTGTGEEVRHTCTMPANTVSTNTSAVRVTIRGTTAATANNKVVRLRIGGIGGTNIYSSGNQVLNNGSWQVQVLVQRTGSAAEFGGGFGTFGTVANTSSLAAGAESFAVDKDWVVTLTTATAIGDATLKSVLYEIQN